MTSYGVSKVLGQQR